MNDLVVAIDTLDLVRLRTFVEVVRLGSVESASRSLACSQPAVSHRLRLLAEDLGVTLFERVGRKLKLTPEGERLRERAEDLLALTREITESLRDQDAARGTVVIGTFAALSSRLLVPVVARLLSAHPQLEVRLVLELAEPLFERLRVGDVDFLCLLGEHDAPGAVADVLGRDRFVAVMAPAIAPRRSGSVAPRELRERRFLAWSGPADWTFRIAEDYARRHRLDRGASTPAQVPHIETLRNLAIGGAGYALLPSYAVREDVASGRLVALRPRGLSRPLPFALYRRRPRVEGAPLTGAAAIAYRAIVTARLVR